MTFVRYLLPFLVVGGFEILFELIMSAARLRVCCKYIDLLTMQEAKHMQTKDKIV